MEPNSTVPDKDLTLDEWVERHASDLSEGIRCHLKANEVEDADGLLRWIMISVRFHWPVKD